MSGAQRDGGEPLEVVKVRLKANVYTSPRVAQTVARAKRDDLRRAVHDIGDAPDFIEFVDRNGREVTLRARDVIAIEVGVPMVDDDAEGHRGARNPRRHGQSNGTGVVPLPVGGMSSPGGPGGSKVSIQVTGRVGDTVTDALQRSIEESMGRHPAGQRR